MLKAVIFDLDGTLIDSTEPILSGYEYTFAQLDLPVPDRQAVLDTIGAPLEVQVPMLTTACTAEEFSSIYRPYYNEHAPGLTVLLPGAKEALDAFAEAGLKIGFATSKKREVSEMLLEHLGVLHHFESCVGPYEVENPKPHPEPLYVSAKNLNLTVEELAFVGDMHFDIHCAQAAGVRAIAVATGYLSREKLEALNAEVVLDDLYAVRDYLLMHRDAAPQTESVTSGGSHAQ